MREEIFLSELFRFAAQKSVPSSLIPPAIYGEDSIFEGSK